MTIVEGQVESLKRLKETLRWNGITRFSSLGEIDRFVKNYATERRHLSSLIERKLEAEIQGMHDSRARYQQIYEESLVIARREMTQEIADLGIELAKARDKSANSLFHKIVYWPRIWSLTRSKSDLQDNFEYILNTRTGSAKAGLDRLKTEIAHLVENKTSISSARLQRSLGDLDRTKAVVDGLYTLIAGAIGEVSVVQALQQLSDDSYLLNDFSLNLDPPIYNNKENDRIHSIQIDHLLVCQSGVFLLETKNWSRGSLENLDLRSPVKQILRTNFAMFVLLNGDSRSRDIILERHHWGSKKIPIRNVIVMVNEKPRQEFRHVKVLSLGELNGYIRYFEKILSAKEVESIVAYLKRRLGVCA